MVAYATGASWPAVGFVLGATLLAMLLERQAARVAAASPLHVSARAARSEGQRDGAAQMMSLQLSYERMRSVLEALGEGVLVVDGGGEIVLANPAAQRAMKTPGQDPAGRVLWEEMKPELAQRARDAWEALRRGTPGDGASLQIRHAGIPCRDRVYDLTAVGVTSARTGQDFGSVFLLVDSTRAHELQRLKDRFLSSVSHELRTPLTNICAFSEILDSLVPREQAEWTEFAHVIHQEGQQLKVLMDEMFDFLRLESGEAVLATEDVDGASVVRALGKQLTAVARDRQIDLGIEVHEAPHLRVDRARLEQVVRSLLDNAIKFTPRGGRVRITVGGRDGCWELRIEDSGPGVPPDDRCAVFEKFHQLSDDLSEKPSGTGLGLATCHALVTRFGGLIWCEEAPGGGASFVVVLPGIGRQPLLGTAAAAAVAAAGPDSGV